MRRSIAKNIWYWLFLTAFTLFSAEIILRIYNPFPATVTGDRLTLRTNTKQVFKNKKGEFRLQVYDILSQNIGISRSSNQNYIEDLSYNVLKRFWQLSFTYNISRFAGKNIAAPGSRKSNIQVIRQ